MPRIKCPICWSRKKKNKNIQFSILIHLVYCAYFFLFCLMESIIFQKITKKNRMKGAINGSFIIGFFSLSLWKKRKNPEASERERQKNLMTINSKVWNEYPNERQRVRWTCMHGIHSLSLSLFYIWKSRIFIYYFSFSLLWLWRIFFYLFSFSFYWSIYDRITFCCCFFPLIHDSTSKFQSKMKTEFVFYQ